MTYDTVATTSLVDAPAGVPASTKPAIGLEQYYEEAGPDYAAWSAAFNMHFGYFRAGANPFDREAMLEQMNAEVLARLGVEAVDAPRLLDLGCGLGATMRSLARRRTDVLVTGITRVPWQVEKATELNTAARCERLRVLEGDYQDTVLPRAQYHGVYALESSCHAKGADKKALIQEAYRLLRPGGRFVVADGFLTSARFVTGLQRRLYQRLCECWVIEELGQLDLFVSAMHDAGFVDVKVEPLQMRVALSVLHIPWVTVKFLLSELVRGKRCMTQARWNNVLAPVILPLVSAPFGPMNYVMISATKPKRG